MYQLKLLILICLTLISSMTVADEVKTGMGAVIGSTSGLFLPIEIGDLFIEPSISAKKSKSDTVSITDVARSGRTSRTLTAGVGLFRQKPITDKIVLYYGARFGYIKRKIKENITASALQPATSKVVRDDGSFISPTIGVQYSFVPQFSFGIDLAFQFSKTDGTETTTVNGVSVLLDTGDTSYSSTASVIARYLF